MEVQDSFTAVNLSLFWAEYGGISNVGHRLIAWLLLMISDVWRQLASMIDQWPTDLTFCNVVVSMNPIKSQIDRPLLLLEVSYVWGFRDSKYSEVLQSKDSQYTENEGSRGRGPATLVSEVIWPKPWRTTNLDIWIHITRPASRAGTHHSRSKDQSRINFDPNTIAINSHCNHCIRCDSKLPNFSQHRTHQPNQPKETSLQWRFLCRPAALVLQRKAKRPSGQSPWNPAGLVICHSMVAMGRATIVVSVTPSQTYSLLQISCDRLLHWLRGNLSSSFFFLKLRAATRVRKNRRLGTPMDTQGRLVISSKSSTCRNLLVLSGETVGYAWCCAS